MSGRVVSDIIVNGDGKMMVPGASLLDSGEKTYRSSKTMNSQESHPDYPKKEGHKWNPDSGEFEKLTEIELARQKLQEEIKDIEKRMKELDEKGQLFPIDYSENLDGSDTEPISDDSLLEDS